MERTIMINGLSPAQHAAEWIVGLVKPDGSIEGATSINEYYKTVFALSVAGRNAEAERMLNYVVRRFLKEDGDLDGNGCTWYDIFRIYPHAWVVIGALLRARFDVAHKILGFLDGFHDEQTGGFYTTIEQREQQGEQDIMTTGIVGLAYLWAGRRDVAAAVGNWMQNLFDAQPNLSAGLYSVWHHGTGLVTKYPEDAAVAYKVDAAKTVQYYFQYGVAAALLSSLYGATAERRWLDLAQKFLQASRHCGEDVYRTNQSGKIGWGGTWTYRLTGDSEDRRIVEEVADGLHSSQQDDGWWPGVNVYHQEETVKLEPDIACTSELMAHLCWIEDCLGATGE